jgi:hypothetical protein
MQWRYLSVHGFGGGKRRGMLQSPEVRRVLSNYLRLLTTFALGIFIVRLLLGAGQEFFGFYSLITIGFGLGIMLKELSRIALVPRLSEGLAGDDDLFGRRFASALCISTVLGLLGAGVMFVLWLNIHRFSVPDQVLDSAKWFVAFRGLQVFITVALSPFPSLLLVMRRYVASNLFIVAERFIEFLAVYVAITLIADFDALLLPVIAGISVALNFVILCFVVIWIIGQDDKFKISFDKVRAEEVRALLSFFGLTAILVLSANLFLRFDIAFVNLKSGILATVVFGVTVQAIGMLNQLTNGLVAGLDAAFAFSKNMPNSEEQIHKLFWVSSFLQASLASSAYAVVVFTGDKLLVIWLGADKLDPTAIQATYSLIVVMGLGMIVRGLAEVWISALNGLGNIKSYVWWLVPGAFLNPILLIVICGQVPDVEVYTIAGFLFTGLQVLTYGLAVPRVLARRMGMPLLKLYEPLYVPIGLTVFVCGILSALNHWSLIHAGAIILTLCLFTFSAALALMYLRQKIAKGFV